MWSQSSCDADLVIHARDVLVVAWLLLIQALFHVLVPIRAMISWIPAACVIILMSSFLIVPSLRLNDGGGTVLLLIILFSGSVIMWFSAFLNEKKDRKLYALNRIREIEASWQHELVQLVFPIVVRVVCGEVTPLSELQQHF